MQKVPERFRAQLLAEKETGMGYWVVDVVLNSGETVKQVVVDSGYFTRAKGFEKLPFNAEQVRELKVTHEKWQFKEGR